VRAITIARNYGEALFLVAERHDAAEEYAGILTALAAVMETDETVRVAFESPRVPKATKQQILSTALADIAPAPFVRFLDAVVKRGRQALFPAIAEQFAGLVDDKMNRVHVGVTLAREPNDELRQVIQERLSAVLAKEAVPTYREDPEILGGMIVRVGDRIMDGSLRRRMVSLRQRMLRG
jgi:F-type H+-transporting ATPase subunit delta